MKLLKRRKKSSVLPQVDDVRLLDIQEQETIVQSLELKHARQNYIWQVIFATLTSIFSGFFLVSALWQLILPWDLKYHALFMDEMGSASVVVADVAEACVYASLTSGLLWTKGSCRNRLWFSFGAGLTLAVFWLYFMTRLPRMHWDVLWLPFGPCRLYSRQKLVDSLQSTNTLITDSGPFNPKPYARLMDGKLELEFCFRSYCFGKGIDFQ